MLTTGDMNAKKIRTTFHIEPELLEALDELRRAESGTLPSRAELLRRLIKRALDAKRAKEPGKR